MLKPVLAGVVSALVGFAGAFAIVLAGLRAAGADEAQAASGLLAVCLASGLVAVVLGLRTRMPVSIAWSTPGAAVLVAAGPPPGGFAAAVGAFLLCGALTVVAGLVPVLSRLVAAIPAPVAGAMLAGVLLPLCLAPVRALVEVPLLAAPVVVVWVVLARLARPWRCPPRWSWRWCSSPRPVRSRSADPPPWSGRRRWSSRPHCSPWACRCSW